MTSTRSIDGNIDRNKDPTSRVPVIYGINPICPPGFNSLVNPNNLSEIVCIVPSTADLISTKRTRKDVTNLYGNDLKFCNNFQRICTDELLNIDQDIITIAVYTFPHLFSLSRITSWYCCWRSACIISHPVKFTAYDACTSPCPRLKPRSHEWAKHALYAGL